MPLLKSTNPLSLAAQIQQAYLSNNGEAPDKVPIKGLIGGGAIPLKSEEQITTREAATPIEEGAFQDLLARANGLPSIQNQRRSANALSDLFEAQKALPVQTDLSPTAGGIKALFGKDVEYKAPQSGQEKLLDLAKVQNLVGNSEEGVTNTILKALKEGADKTTTIQKGALKDVIKAEPRTAMGKVAKPVDYSKEAERYGKDLGDLVPRMTSAAATLAPYLQKGIKIPGFDPLEKIGGAVLGDAGLSNEAQKVKQAAVDAVTANIYLTSGKTINQQEAERELGVRGMKFTSSPESFQRGMGKLLQDNVQLLNNKKARYHPEATQLYETRGGTGPKEYEQAIRTKPNNSSEIKAGDIKGKYKFKGGDPGKESNWDLIK